MKTTLFILVFSQVTLLAQINEHLHWPMTFDGNTFEDLRDSNLIVDHVWFETTKIYSKRKLSPKIHEEYIKVNDTVYYYKKSNLNTILEKGYFKIDRSKNIKADTSTIFCRDFGYEEVIQLNYWHEPIKSGRWRYFENDTTSIVGNYTNNKKNGIWTTRVGKVKKSIHYSMNEVDGYYNPTEKEIRDNISWLYENEFYVFATQLVENETIRFTKLGDFKIEPINKGEYLILKFYKNNVVEIRHFKQNELSNQYFEGTYNFNIDKESNFIIDLKEHGVSKRKIEYFSKTRIK